MSNTVKNQTIPLSLPNLLLVYYFPNEIIRAVPYAEEHLNPIISFPLHQLTAYLPLILVSFTFILCFFSSYADGLDLPQGLKMNSLTPVS